VRALLDVNVLIALLDADHVNHTIAWTWLEDNIESGWATCPITQNGCLRIMSQPRYPHHFTCAEVAEHFRAATDTQYHEFWPDRLSILDSHVIDWKSVIGPNQLTDIYLLALAVENNGYFVTFDKKITSSLVVGADSQHYVII